MANFAQREPRVPPPDLWRVPPRPDRGARGLLSNAGQAVQEVRQADERQLHVTAHRERVVALRKNYTVAVTGATETVLALYNVSGFERVVVYASRVTAAVAPGNGAGELKLFVLESPSNAEQDAVTHDRGPLASGQVLAFEPAGLGLWLGLKVQGTAGDKVMLTVVGM